MNFSKMIVEVLIIGCFAAIGIVLLDTGTGGRLHEFVKVFREFIHWPTSVVALVAAATFYHLGWLVNGAAILITRWLRRRMISRVFGANVDDYAAIRARVFQKASSASMDRIGVDHTVLRLARAGVVNFSLITIGLLVQRSSVSILSVLTWMLVCVSLLQTRHQYRVYYARILRVYEELIREPHA